MAAHPKNATLALQLLSDLAGWQHYSNRQAAPVADQRMHTAELVARCQEQGMPVPEWLARLDEGVSAHRVAGGFEHHYTHPHHDPNNRAAHYAHLLGDPAGDPEGDAQYEAHMEAMAQSGGRFGDTDAYEGTTTGWEGTDADLDRWESKLKKALRAGKPLASVPFSSFAIAPSLQEIVRSGLPAVHTPSDLKRLFARVLDTPLRSRKR